MSANTIIFTLSLSNLEKLRTSCSVFFNYSRALLRNFAFFSFEYWTWAYFESWNIISGRQIVEMYDPFAGSDTNAACVKLFGYSNFILSISMGCVMDIWIPWWVIKVPLKVVEPPCCNFSEGLCLKCCASVSSNSFNPEVPTFKVSSVCKHVSSLTCDREVERMDTGDICHEGRGWVAVGRSGAYGRFRNIINRFGNIINRLQVGHRAFYGHAEGRGDQIREKRVDENIWRASYLPSFAYMNGKYHAGRWLDFPDFPQQYEGRYVARSVEPLTRMSANVGPCPCRLVISNDFLISASGFRRA